jgi:hypothetical protein
MNAHRSIIMLAEVRSLVKEKLRAAREKEDNGGDQQPHGNNDESLMAGPLPDLLRMSAIAFWAASGIRCCPANSSAARQVLTVFRPVAIRYLFHLNDI